MRRSSGGPSGPHRQATASAGPGCCGGRATAAGCSGAARTRLLAYTAAEAALGTRPSGEPWWEERCHLALSWIGLLGFTRPERLPDGLATYGPLVEQHGTAEQRSHLFSSMGDASLRDDRYVAGEQTLAYYRAGLAAGRESRNIFAVMWMGAALGYGLLTASRLDEAEAELTEALGQAVRAGDAVGRIACLTWLTTLHRRRGDVAGARRLAESALEAARAVPTFGDAEDPVAHARADLAWVAWREGDDSRAEELAREAWSGWDGYPLQRAFAWLPVFPLLGLALRAGGPSYFPVPEVAPIAGNSACSTTPSEQHRVPGAGTRKASSPGPFLRWAVQVPNLRPPACKAGTPLRRRSRFYCHFKPNRWLTVDGRSRRYAVRFQEIPGGLGRETLFVAKPTRAQRLHLLPQLEA